MVISIDQPHTVLCKWYRVMGLTCALATDSPQVLAAARASFGRAIRPDTAAPDFTLRFWVDRKAGGSLECSSARFRGLNHLVWGGFGRGSACLIDLRRRRALGRFSPGVAADVDCWRRVLLPNAVGLMSEALGLTALHCATVEKDGHGLLIAGGSGAGKSILSLALARRGFRFLSDDWTYFSYTNGRLCASHIAAPIKLLPDAVQFFPELRTLNPHVSLNGEIAYEIDPETLFGVNRALACEPMRIVFVERRREPGHRLSRIPPQEAAARLEYELEDLPGELADVGARQSAIVWQLASRKCWLFEHGENPDRAAEILERLCADPETYDEPGPTEIGEPLRFRRRGPDILRRFTPTALAADFLASFDIGPSTIRLETNSSAILAQISALLPPADAGWPSQFLWRLIADNLPVAETALMSSRTPATAVPILRADGLYLENIEWVAAEQGQQFGFFAVDAEARLAIAFIEASLVRDTTQFRHIVSRLAAATGAALAGNL